MATKIKNHFSPSEKTKSYGDAFKSPNRKPAQQQFKQDADINSIMRKFQRGEALNHVKVYQGEYGIASPLDLHQAQNLIARANSMFADLPSNVRNEFKNEPAQFLEFVQNPDNYDRAIELGISLAPEALAAREASIAAVAAEPPLAEPAPQAPD